MNMRQKRDLNLMRRVVPVRKTIRDWFYHAGIKFVNSRQLTDLEENFLEEVTDFYMNILDNIEDIEREVNEETSKYTDDYDALTAVLWTEHYSLEQRNASAGTP